MLELQHKVTELEVKGREGEHQVVSLQQELASVREKLHNHEVGNDILISLKLLDACTVSQRQAFHGM